MAVNCFKLLTPPIGPHALVRDPGISWQPPSLPEHIDRHSTARMKVAADSQPAWFEMSEHALADSHRAILMERRMIAEAVEKQLQGFRFDEKTIRHVVDDHDGEIRLPGYRAHGGEFWKRESRHIIGVRVGVRYAIEHGLSGRRGNLARLSEVDRVVWHIA